MNIEYAKTIPLREILSKLGLSPLVVDGDLLIYQSPFSDDISHNLIVNTKANTWTESHRRISGSPIDLVREVLKEENSNPSAPSVLRWLKNKVGYVKLIPPAQIPDYTGQDSRYLIRDINPINSGFLISYLEDQRRIPFDHARFLLNEITFIDQKTGKELKALGMRNEDDGFSIRNPHLKAHVGAKNISFIRSKVDRAECIHIFKDVFDYLSVVTHAKGKSPKGDIIILNSLQCFGRSDAYIKNYGYREVYTWLDNSDLGNKITKAYSQFFKTEPGLRHIRMNSLYSDYIDVNGWCIAGFPQSQSIN